MCINLVIKTNYLKVEFTEIIDVGLRSQIKYVLHHPPPKPYHLLEQRTNLL
jgi:hypothetical protein